MHRRVCSLAISAAVGLTVVVVCLAAPPAVRGTGLNRSLVCVAVGSPSQAARLAPATAWRRTQSSTPRPVSAERRVLPSAVSH